MAGTERKGIAVARLSVKERTEILRLHKEGLPVHQIAKEMSRSWWTVKAVLHPTAATHERLYSPGPARLSMSDREEIRAGLVGGETFTAIAARLGRATSTISREVEKNGGRTNYRAHRAHRRAARCARRPKVAKLMSRPVLRAEVEGWLEELWSPAQIAQRLRLEHPDDPMMWVSHETIYQSLFVQGRGALRAELVRCLRTGRVERRPRGRAKADRRGKIPGMVMVSERPAEASDRAVPGHWEGDLIIGKNHGSAIGTLVERTTRYVLLLHLPEGGTAEAVNAAMATAIGRLPDKLVRSITWDQGTEMSKHADFTVATGIQVYFCDPHSPWQRPSNENTNGLLRQFFPKGSDLSAYSRADLDEAERKLNGRPRKSLDWYKPSEKMVKLVALTG
ncbi:MAG: IS30 family transposase [Acidimicrobiales bacterium]